MRKKVRVRSCALIRKDHSLLLVQLRSPVRPMPIWMPPGGEVEPGEPIVEGMKREVREETGLSVEPLRLSLVHEFIEPPYHTIEFYHVCRLIGGEPHLGEDPERGPDEQILLDLAYFPIGELAGLELYPAILRNHPELLDPAGETVFAGSYAENF